MSIAKTLKNENKNHPVNGIRFSHLPKIVSVAFIKDEIAFVLSDNRIVYIPMKWSKKLLHATDRQRANFKNGGLHVFWDDVGEIIGVKNIILGKELFV